MLRENIEAEMQKNDLRQVDMAKRLKISEKTWRNWMKDPNEITVGYLICIASILNTTPDALIAEDVPASVSKAITEAVREAVSAAIVEAVMKAAEGRKKK